MCSELECSVCYLVYNAGRRCPRELHCRHSFCESCLLALSRPRDPDAGRVEADRSIACPLCRHTTFISGEGKIRAELRVDECVLERLLVAGLLDQEEEDEPEDEGGDCPDSFDVNEEAADPETSAEESDSSTGSGDGTSRWSWRKVWRKIKGKSSRQRDRQNCMTSDDLRNFAMMSSYMF